MRSKRQQRIGGTEKGKYAIKNRKIFVNSSSYSPEEKGLETRFALETIRDSWLSFLRSLTQMICPAAEESLLPAEDIHKDIFKYLGEKLDGHFFFGLGSVHLGNAITVTVIKNDDDDNDPNDDTTSVMSSCTAGSSASLFRLSPDSVRFLSPQGC